MKISREARRTARELFRLSLVNGRVDRNRVEEISNSVIAQRPRSFLEILKEYTRLIRIELAKRHAIVESAVALDSTEVSEIEKNLKSRFGDDITVEFGINSSLLGGLRVKLGSDVWDGSISSRLATLSNQI